MNPNFQGRVPPAKLSMYANPPINSSPPWLIDSRANIFSLDNWCSLTLNPFDFNVKDLTMGKMLFRGPVRQGLYPF